jgi:hypothetical protein
VGEDLPRTRYRSLILILLAGLVTIANAKPPEREWKKAKIVDIQLKSSTVNSAHIRMEQGSRRAPPSAFRM